MAFDTLNGAQKAELNQKFANAARLIALEGGEKGCSVEAVEQSVLSVLEYAELCGLNAKQFVAELGKQKAAATFLDALGQSREADIAREKVLGVFQQAAGM